MNHEQRTKWQHRHQETTPGAPEPALIEMLPLIPCGLALDVAAGTGRHAIPLAQASFRVVAADFSATGLQVVQTIARREKLAIMPVLADLETALPFDEGCFDAIVNINFLDHGLLPRLKQLLRVDGTMFFETFLVDQTEFGHPRDTRFMLQHFELRELLSDMEIVRYREGLTIYPNETRAWRATALARRRA